MLRWSCPLPGHRGYPAVFVNDAHATIWTCAGACGSGDLDELHRRMGVQP